MGEETTWAARPSRGVGSWPVIGLGVVLLVVGAVLTVRSAPCASFHPATQLAGSDRRLATWLDGCPADLDEGRISLALGLVFVAGYAVMLTSVLRRWWPLYQTPRLKSAERAVVALPLVAAALQVVAGVLILAILDTADGRFRYPDRMLVPIIVATVSWIAWFALATAVIASVMAVMLGFARRHEVHTPTIQPVDPTDRRRDEPDGLGVCCSGGGIRAAAFSLGAMDSLERAGVMDEARWLTAVSGGSYAATAWRLARAADPARSAASDVIAWLEAPPRGGAAGGRHRFLRNGPGGLGRPVLAAILYVLFNLVVLAALVAALAWPFGWLLGSSAVQPVLRTMRSLPSQIDTPAELWMPGLLTLLVAAVVLGLSALPSWSVAGWWRLAAALAALGVLLEVVLVVSPLAMVIVGQFMQGGVASARAALIGSTALAGVAAAVWRIAGRPVASRFADQWPRLGGVLLAVVAVVWGGKVATDAATGSGLLASAWWWVVISAAFVAVYALVGISRPTIHRIYRKRLRRTFGVARDEQGELVEPPPDDQLTWGEMPDDRPELVICCAQQRTGIAPGGLPAETFTISRSEVRIGADVVATDTYLDALPPDLQVERHVVSWVATSGAAFASAMGRMSQGSTNALMAALNIDLGIWLPNPRLVADPDIRFPKVRLGYLFKEILGWYDPADRYVFVADGGHWENLGLVELLRRRCRTIVCIDASGDQVGAFTALREAVELAGLELPDIVADIDLTALEKIGPVAGGLPAGLVASLRVMYRGEGGATFEGTIHFAKAQLASDLDIALRRFAKVDRRFPGYSTGDQFLSDEQFRQLVALGRIAGERLATLVESRP